MITVREQKEQQQTTTYVDERILLSSDVGREELIQSGKTCFMGRADDSSAFIGLFLVTFSSVVMLSQPSLTWTDNTYWVIDKWVDIVVTVK